MTTFCNAFYESYHSTVWPQRRVPELNRTFELYGKGPPFRKFPYAFQWLFLYFIQDRSFLKLWPSICLPICLPARCICLPPAWVSFKTSLYSRRNWNWNRYLFRMFCFYIGAASVGVSMKGEIRRGCRLKTDCNIPYSSFDEVVPYIFSLYIRTYASVQFWKFVIFYGFDYSD